MSEKILSVRNDERVEPHCLTCTCGKRAKVQADHANSRTGRAPHAAGTVTWAEHLQAYTAYAAINGSSQSAERIDERQGFSYWEMADLLGHEPETWRPR